MLVSLFLGAALISGVAAEKNSLRPDLAPNGYELLPNARWLEELERDGRTTFLDASRSWLELPLIEPTLGLGSARMHAFQIDLHKYRLSVPLESTDSLAGGFRFERDPTTRFLYDDEYKHERKRKIWSIPTWLLKGELRSKR
jgi:hypothetical protein